MARIPTSHQHSRPSPARPASTALAALATLVIVGITLAGCGSGHTTHTANSGTTPTTSTTTATTSATATTATQGSQTAPPAPLYPPGGAPPPGRSPLSRAELANLPPVPVSTGPGASTPAVTVHKLDAATNAALIKAFYNATELTPDCPVQIAANTPHLAKINATGEMIALAGFFPAPGCKELYGGPPERAVPFNGPDPTEVIFTQSPGQQWQATSAGAPFPCPPVAGVTPLVPNDVLKAWDIPYYSSTCLPTINSLGSH